MKRAPAKPAAKRGNTTKYTDDMPARLVALMSEGMSIYEIAREFGVARPTLYKYRDEYPEMGEAFRNGEDLSRAWWEKQGRENLHNKGFNTAVWFINMKNRFRWRDNPDDIEDDAGDAPEVVQV